MADYRRYFVAGGTYFFTLVTYRRRPLLTSKLARTCLREAIATRRELPFKMLAVVLLPEHLHVIWGLPPADADYATRWRRIKQHFTTGYLAGGGRETRPSVSRQKRGERGVWQRRFWEHLIRDDDDFERHFDYIHYNPVKHGLVGCPYQWPHSTFSRCVAAGIYDPRWGCRAAGVLDFKDIEESAHE